MLEGNGVKGFTTPLATLHKFQGWADKFLTTPANGIDDRYVNAGFTLKGVGPLDTLSAQASYHEYEAERVSLDYGDEVNVQVQAKCQRFLGTLKYARLFRRSTAHRYGEVLGAVRIRLVDRRYRSSAATVAPFPEGEGLSQKSFAIASHRPRMAGRNHAPS